MSSCEEKRRRREEKTREDQRKRENLAVSDFDVKMSVHLWIKLVPLTRSFPFSRPVLLLISVTPSVIVILVTFFPRGDCGNIE
jgi:hypothetical protein